MKNYKHVIEKGLQFLKNNQEKDGSFLCLVSETLDDYKKSEQVPAIVPSNIVLSSLAHVPQTKIVTDIRKKTAHFLLKERGEYWSFNYWFRKSDWYTKEPYPDDTDDTFCALAALYEYDRSIFDGDVMAKIMVMLTSCEKKEGGPYDMWLVSEHARDTWNDTDLVVNSNIAYFLHLNDTHLPELQSFIEEKIDSDGYEFPYNTLYPAVYFISRFYKGSRLERMKKMLLDNVAENGSWENPLRTALAVSSLINFSNGSFINLDKSIDYLKKTQGKDGSWKAYSFFYQMRTSKKTLFAGSSSITTALCLEAISKYEKSEFSIRKKTEGKIILSKEEVYIKNKIVKKFKERLSKTNQNLGKKAFEFMDHIVKKDTHGVITLLPYFFYQSFSLRYKNKKVNNDLFITLGLAHVYGWSAYTIYDDFLDMEGDPNLLSVANVCLRESYSIFSRVEKMYSTSNFVENIFDTIDSANLWETNHCRNKNGISGTIPHFGNLSQLAEKSLGHSISTLLLCVIVGIHHNSKEFKHIFNFFKHYLISRQLNDDAHDWEEDMNNGRITPVVAKIFKKVKNKEHTANKFTKIFWEDVLDSVCKDVLHHSKIARECIHKVSCITHKNILVNKLIVPIETSAHKALVEKKETLAFITSYSRK